MSVPSVEENLRGSMGNPSIANEDDIPFKSYNEFLELEKNQKLNISSKYDTALVENFGSTGEVIMQYVLITLPYIIALACLILTFVLGNYWLLLGILLSLLGGIVLSNPSFINSIGSLVMGATFIYFCYSLYMGNSTATILSGSYVIPNFLVTVAREQCRMIVHRVILESELIFIWLYKSKQILISNN